MKEILLWGTKSQAKILHKMIDGGDAGKARVSIIFDPTSNEDCSFSNAPLIRETDALRQEISNCTHFVLGIGAEHGAARIKIHSALTALGLDSVSLVSKYATLDDITSIGGGLQVMPGAIVHKFTQIGDQCILNTNCAIDHECRIGNGVHVMGGACIAGRVTIGNAVSIGTNATILPDISIGEGAFVGAGAVVTKDVAERSVVVGIPAKHVRKHEPVFNYDCVEQIACWPK